ncbi:MAG: Holliday junction branch migration protein RuvA [Coriobacteriaceae bacterium]|uniref:Holliday junction branch migration protein RuvA n=1 Tax=Tractidigestivibacter sp. TaxID=2847320 RepID=UPI002A7F4A1B|nr:Holliday junction branch migration protein RuvA [Tractidigestivibacter sp.]MCI6274675.1 Holliday junction branch migration protein RuvA [Coriobacteriaceae bacterium]MCI6548429.1 Holliday junction branch migration protein RuvA [Coriobacteriaceae bacterium]MCI6843874.1 Holliday junction branch migration protein RuvA [Coriobacteriaceae bacterium]MCI7439351.1 Holliday junction branch migration protein RuvA [Coriobacteriaceae bacterium]MDD7583862.1 Holliday junction branch migration protein RuvA
MIVQLTGTLVEVLPTHVVIDVAGVGYELGVSATTAASLPPAGEAGVTVLTRMLVKESAVELYGFATREERAVFDRLVAVSGVGPKLALAVLSTFSPATLATIVTLQDEGRMAQVPGVGRKKAQRLLVELQDVFAKDVTLRGLAGMGEPSPRQPKAPDTAQSVTEDATAALLSMGFSPQEAQLALDGHEDAGAVTVERAIQFALKRLGGSL